MIEQAFEKFFPDMEAIPWKKITKSPSLKNYTLLYVQNYVVNAAGVIRMTVAPSKVAID